MAETDRLPAARRPRPRLLVLASTFPARGDDGTPAFVRDLAIEESRAFDTLVLVPRVSDGARRERVETLQVVRFAYFPRRWEALAEGAIVENLRRRPVLWLQVVPFLLAEAIAVRRAVRRFRPDVVHAHWVVPQGLVVTLAAPGTPRLLTAHGGDLYAFAGRPLRLLKSWVVRRATYVTTVNAEMLQVARALGASRDSSTVLPMGAAVQAGSPRPAAAGDGGPCRFVFVGRLVEKKGVAVLLEALRRVDPSVAELLVVGDGPLRGPLERQAAGLPVTFLGQLGREAVMSVLDGADVAVFPSVTAASGDQDGLPVALLEAMARGLAVVASSLPGIGEVVEDGVNGLLAPPGDVERLRAALESLIPDEPRRRELGRRAAQRAREFSVQAVGERYRALLKQVARRPAAPRFGVPNVPGLARPPHRPRR